MLRTLKTKLGPCQVHISARYAPPSGSFATDAPPQLRGSIGHAPASVQVKQLFPSPSGDGTPGVHALYSLLPQTAGGAVNTMGTPAQEARVKGFLQVKWRSQSADF